jgi:hypothetical protein
MILMFKLEYTKMQDLLETIVRRSEANMLMGSISLNHIEINASTRTTIAKRLYRHAIVAMDRNKLTYTLDIEHPEDYVMLKLMLA